MDTFLFGILGYDTARSRPVKHKICAHKPKAMMVISPPSAKTGNPGGGGADTAFNAWRVYSAQRQRVLRRSKLDLIGDDNDDENDDEQISDALLKHMTILPMKGSAEAPVPPSAAYFEELMRSGNVPSRRVVSDRRAILLKQRRIERAQHRKRQQQQHKQQLQYGRAELNTLILNHSKSGFAMTSIADGLPHQEAVVIVGNNRLRGRTHYDHNSAIKMAQKRMFSAIRA